MTPFKEKLNKELGESSFFTKELQVTILQKAQQPSKKQRHWQYPFVLASATMIMLFFIIIGPWTTTNTSKQATIDEIAKNEAVKQFTTASNWQDDTFKAGRVGWIFGQQEFQQGQETELLQQVLQHAELSEKHEHYRTFRDVWLQFENGQIAKLKMQIEDEQLAFIDMDTNLFYKVDAMGVDQFPSKSFEDDSFISNNFFSFLLCLTVVTWLVEKVVRKVFDIQKGPKYVSQAHKRASIIFSVVNCMVLLTLLVTGWVIYIGATIAIVFSLVFSNIVMDYYYGREEKRHYVSIAMTMVGIPFLIAFFYFFRYKFWMKE